VFAPRSGRYLVPGIALLAPLILLAVLNVFSARLLFAIAAVAVAGLVAFVAWFLRDPTRPIGAEIVSAADGRVRAVVRERDRWRISVFMNVTDVHVNRFPLDATVVGISDAGSGFRPAYRDDADHNSRRHYTLETAVGLVEVVQMTGIVARRLVSLSREGERHLKGDRLGMILFGSRVDVLLPATRTEPLVQVSEVVRAGVTPIARERR
jgi:phosphatidylserine decarboxylase